MKKLLLCFLIPFFAFCNNLDLIGINESKLVRHLSNDPTESGSHATIDYQGEVVVKTYSFTKQGRRAFMNERSAMEKLQTPDTVRLLGWAETEESGTLIIERAPGISLNTLIKEHNLPHLETALIQMAQTMSRLHERAPLNDASRTHKKLAQRFVQMYHTNTQFDADAYAERYLKNDTKERGGTIHYDLHPGNIFYDPLTQKITLIDLEMVRSGPLAYDFENALIQLEAKLIQENYAPQTIHHLTTLFATTYLKLQPLTSEELEKERQYVLMDMAITFTQPDDKLGAVALNLIANTQ